MSIVKCPTCRPRTQAMLLLPLLCLVACGSSPTDDGDGGDDQDVPATVTMTLDRAIRARNETFVLTPVVRDADNQVIEVVVTFTSSVPEVANVDASGGVTTLNLGKTTIRATAGTAKAEVEVTVVNGTLVGPAGGTVTAGTAQLTIPAGALTAERVVALGTISAPLLDPSAVAATYYELGPADLSFAEPATLAMTIPAAGGPIGLPIEAFGIRRLHSGAWVNADQPGIDVATRRATAKVAGAGKFGGGRLMPTQPCTAPEHRQFDYWIGAWRVSVGGQVVANSDITAEPGGCAILERFTPFGGGTGLSISHYNPATGKWYQTYVDNAGFRLLMTGGVDDQGQMTMYTNPGGQQTERWAWLKEGPNVRQRADFTANGGASYQSPHFDGLYAPR